MKFCAIEDPDGKRYEVETDETLEREGIPADAAAVGKRIKEMLAKMTQLMPEFANSIDECTDTSKLYVLPDGYIYAYVLTQIWQAGSKNLVPLATASGGGVYNSKGYVLNKRLNSAAAEKRLRYAWNNYRISGIRHYCGL